MPTSTLDSREFRTALGEFATGVTVVTTISDGVPSGATVNAFTSVSLDPPLVLVSLDRRSKSCQRLAGQPFTINVLARTQAALAWQFAGRPQVADDEIGWDFVDDAGTTFAVLQGAAASFLCSPWAEYDGGDHLLFVGRVEQFRRCYCDPLLFHGGAFCSITESARVDLNFL